MYLCIKYICVACSSPKEERTRASNDKITTNDSRADSK